MRLRDKIMLALAVTAALVVTALLVPGQAERGRIGKPNPALCEHVMRQAYAAGETLANRPPECDGVDQKTLEAIVARVLTEEEPGAGTDTLITE